MIACDAKEFKKCETYVKSKMIKKSSHNVERSSNLFDLIHSDLCELNDMLTRGGNRYFLTFINNCSRFTYVFLLKNKSETFNAFKVFKTEVENQLSKKIKVFKSDRGGEYFSSEFNSFCEEYGIVHECIAT